MQTAEQREAAASQHQGASYFLVESESLLREVETVLSTLSPRIALLPPRGHDAPNAILPCDPKLVDAVFLPADVHSESEPESLRNLIEALKLELPDVPIILLLSERPQTSDTLWSLAFNVGASTCIVRSDLSPTLVEQVVFQAHARSRIANHYDELRERFALILRGANDGLWEWEPHSGRAFFSPRWKQILGYSANAIENTLEAWTSRIHPHDRHRVQSDLQALVDGEQDFHDCEYRIKAADDSYRWVHSRAAGNQRTPTSIARIAGSLTDLSPYRKRERDLHERSRQDAITRLPSRDVLIERISRALELSQRYPDFEFAVLLIELDRLPLIRDSYGQRAVDNALRVLTKRFKSCLRPEDFLCRFAPSKFAVLLEDIEEKAYADRISKRIRGSLKQALVMEGATVYTSVGIGITSSDREYRNADEVLSDASAALSRACTRGSDRHELFDTSIRLEALESLRLESDLREAIESETGFELHYQPIVDGPNRHLLGFEALLRWFHPKRGVIPPVDFIPIAEKTGMIVPLGDWVAREGARRLASWRNDFELAPSDLSLSINLSARQLASPRLMHDVDAILSETGLDPHGLKFELTESVIMENPELSTKRLGELRKRGIRIYIDDFGTGYSSLGYLHRFPADGLKIDRSFVSSLATHENSVKMVHTILELAQQLGLNVVAEGIETEEQARILDELGCPSFQGYLFGKAVPPGEAMATIARDLEARS